VTKSEIVAFIRSDLIPHCALQSGQQAVDIEITGSITRSTSRLWFANLVCGPQQVAIVAKCGVSGQTTPHRRLPRLTPMCSLPQMIPRQALALQAIDREFSNLANPCFAVIRVLLQNDDRRVLIMNRDPGTELLHYLNTTALPTGAAARKDLPSYSRMAGEWLRLFHDRVPLEPGVRVYNQASELLEQATSWLGTLEMVDHVWRARVENRIAECAGKLNGLPRTTLHGDYWPGNILANNGRIAIIDVLGWAEGPCWLDIAYFLLHLRATDKQVWLHNAAWSDRLLTQAEHEFLAGYFGAEPVDPHAKAFFMTLALLAKWSRRVETLQESSGLQRARKQAMFAWNSRYYRTLMNSILGTNRC